MAYEVEAKTWQLVVIIFLTSATQQVIAETNHHNYQKHQEKTMSDTELLVESFDRSPPSEVAPVLLNGKRYQQHIGTHDDKIGQSGGLLDIFEDATGKLITTIKVYDNVRNPEFEGDVQDIFFESMIFDAHGLLIITDEVGRRFAVDVDKLTSTLLAE